MKRALLLTVAALALLAFGAPAREAQAAVSVGISINTGGRHGGFSLNFQSRPDLVLIPSSRVYYVRNYDHDLYCYGNDWYYVDDGNWYTSRSYRGPFVQVVFASVPYEIRSVPVSYRRHWGRTYSAPTYGYGTRDRSWIDRTHDSDRNRSWASRSQSWERDRQNQDRGDGRNWGDRDRNGDRGQNKNRNRGNRGNRGGNGNHRGWNRG